MHSGCWNTALWGRQMKRNPRELTLQKHCHSWLSHGFHCPRAGFSWKPPEPLHSRILPHTQLGVANSRIKMLPWLFLPNDISKFSPWTWSSHFINYCPFWSGGERISWLWILFTLTPSPWKNQKRIQGGWTTSSVSVVCVTSLFYSVDPCKCHMEKSVSLLELLQLSLRQLPFVASNQSE